MLQYLSFKFSGSISYSNVSSKTGSKLSTTTYETCISIKLVIQKSMQKTLPNTIKLLEEMTIINSPRQCTCMALGSYSGSNTKNKP